MRNPDSPMYQKLDRTVEKLVLTIASASMSGLDMFGMLVVTFATQAQVVGAMTRGMMFKHSIAPEQVDLTQMQSLRELFLEASKINQEEVLAEFDRVIAHLQASTGVHDKVAGPVPSIEDLKRMYNLTPKTPAPGAKS